MAEDTMAPPAEGQEPGHLDDEAISAVLDGEAGAEETAHVGSCRRCSSRLEQFDEVAQAVAVPVEPVGADRRRTSVVQAIAAGSAPGAVEAPTALALDPGAGVEAQEPTIGQDTTDPASERSPGSPVPRSGAGRRPRRAAHPDESPVVPLSSWRRSLQGRGPVWAAAAAVVVALAVSVPLLGRLSGTSTSLDQAADSASESFGAGGSSVGTAADGGDLGDLGPGDLEALARMLHHDLSAPAPALSPPGNAAPSPPEGAPPPALGPDSDPSPAADGRLSTATEAARPLDEGSGSTGTSDQEAQRFAADAQFADQVRQCEAEIRSRLDLGALAYVARARFDARPAVVLGFAGAASGPSGPGRGRVLVLSLDDCTELAAADA